MHVKRRVRSGGCGKEESGKDVWKRNGCAEKEDKGREISQVKDRGANKERTATQVEKERKEKEGNRRGGARRASGGQSRAEEQGNGNGSGKSGEAKERQEATGGGKRAGGTRYAQVQGK